MSELIDVNKFKSRYVIAALDARGRVTELLEDFYALTYEQAQFRVNELAHGGMKLYEASTLEGWTGDAFGRICIVSGKLCFKHDPTIVGGKIISGTEQFAANLGRLQHDLEITLKQDGCFAVTYDGVLWAQGNSAETVLGSIGEEIDKAYTGKQSS